MHNGQDAVGASGAWATVTWGRPTYGVGRPPGGPAAPPLWPGSFPTVTWFNLLVHDQSFARNDVQNNFPRDFETQKIFLV